MRSKYLIVFLSIFYFIFLNPQETLCQDEGWRGKDFFKIDYYQGRPFFISPAREPFFAISMVYAYGPEAGENAGNITAERVIKELELMKKHGFNTLDLYGDLFLKDILDWCEENKMAIYFRTSYTHLPDFPKELSEFPDFMDENFRDKAKHYYDEFLATIRDYRCVLAIDMDQRWLFDIDWSGQKRFGIPKLGKASIAYLPKWLEDKYKDIKKLNSVWGRNYSSFQDILADTQIIKNNVAQDLNRHPWRGDLVEYTLWTINDFLIDLIGYMKLIDPNHMITYTTELPEVIPFPLSTEENSGIDFISPVHYNSLADFDRDWVGNAEMLYMTKFHYDLQKLPVYINETGFRTSGLEAKPINMTYAAARLGDEEHVAELYLKQTALMNTYPWLLGWAYFKWYDKWSEGDFGYIRDDGSLKPISKLGQFINSQLPINEKAEGKPEAWIYYPTYSLASEEAGYSQLKSLVLLLENDFLAEFEKMIEEIKPYISNPSDKMLDKRVFKDLSTVFNEKWRDFAFTSSIPASDKPIILAGANLKQLSKYDRKVLETKRTITFGPIGIRDERYNETEPYFAELVGLDMKEERRKFLPQDIKNYFNSDGLSSKRKRKKANLDGDGNSINKKFLPALGKKFELAGVELRMDEVGLDDNISCQGQTINFKAGSYTSIYFLMTSTKGDIAAKLKLNYEDGSSKKLYFAPAVSDWKTRPHFAYDELVSTINTPRKITKEKAYLALIRVPISPTKVLKSVTLPKVSKVHIFAITLAKGEDINWDSYCEVNMQGIKVKGTTGWLMVGNEGNYKTLATFSNGAPAIVQSKDGRHVAFLFDALSWVGKKDEISRDTQNLSRILDKILIKLEEGN